MGLPQILAQISPRWISTDDQLDFLQAVQVLDRGFASDGFFNCAERLIVDKPVDVVSGCKRARVNLQFMLPDPMLKVRCDS
jgi:hypothetical protein